MKRVIAYVDGQNLYYGLRNRFGRRYHWLDIEKLTGSLLPAGHRLVAVEYFTARVRANPPSVHRQADYLIAMSRCCPRVRIVEGRFQRRTATCRSCGSMWVTFDEKETDVNIAAAIVRDAATHAFDTALLVSGDGDLAPAIHAGRRLAPEAAFTVAWPPHRHSDALRAISDAAFTIGETKIRNAQLPDKVTLTDGTVLERPAYWRQ